MLMMYKVALSCKFTTSQQAKDKVFFEHDRAAASVPLRLNQGPGLQLPVPAADVFTKGTGRLQVVE